MLIVMGIKADQVAVLCQDIFERERQEMNMGSIADLNDRLTD